jgi:hypothetical protein
VTIHLHIHACYNERANTTQLSCVVRRVEATDKGLRDEELHGQIRELVWDEGQVDSVRISALKAIERWGDYAFFASSPF